MGVSVFPAASGGVTQKVQEFTSTGTFVVPSNCTAVEVFLVGGGGGAGNAGQASASCAGGGGGGGQVIPGRIIPVTAGASYTVTIGAGGTGSSGNGAGGFGNDSSFGSLLVAQGGGGGGTIDSSGTQINPSIKATVGAFPNSAVGRVTWGSGAATFISANTSTQPFNLVSSPSAKSGYAVSFIASNSGSDGMPGLGIQGFGGGGASGNNGTSYPTQSFDNGATSTGGVEANGNNATANRGGGGGGGYKQSTNAVRAGGNGGSGYALITYWS